MYKKLGLWRKVIQSNMAEPFREDKDEEAVLEVNDEEVVA